MGWARAEVPVQMVGIMVGASGERRKLLNAAGEGGEMGIGGKKWLKVEGILELTEQNPSW